MDQCVNSKVLKPYPLGWKAKIGILLPAHDTGYGSYEFRVLCPEGVVTLETRVMGGSLTLEELKKMRADAVHGAQLLAVAETRCHLLHRNRRLFCAGGRWGKGLGEGVAR